MALKRISSSHPINFIDFEAVLTGNCLDDVEGGVARSGHVGWAIIGSQPHGIIVKDHGTRLRLMCS